MAFLKTVLLSAALASASLAIEPEAGLVLHYSFDEGAVQDQSGHGNDAEVVGNAKWVRGEFGSALEFNGEDTYVDCGAKPSLNIGKAGTVAFWFKPNTACQGGLVGWAKGEGRPNQRLVVSLNSYMEDRVDGNHLRQALSLCISDGKDFDLPYRSDQHKAYFPPTEKWLFYTVTFNGRAVEIYRDGVHVQTRFQTLIPDTANVPVLIGKCFGMGGPSDYFKGLIDETRVYNRPLSSQEIYTLYMRDASGRGGNTAGFKSINIELTVMPKAGRVFVDLDYRGLAPTPKNLSIKAELLDEKGAIIAKGKVRMLPAWGRAEAVFDAAELPGGRYTVSAVAAKGKPANLDVNWPGRAQGWENVNVLNNFCWELLNVSPGVTSESKYAFNNPRRGWVCFSTETEDGLTLTLPGAKPQTIHAPEKGVKQEVMRWMDRGSQTITVRGKGTLKSLSVRAVPMLLFWAYPCVGPGTGMDHDFLVKHVLGPYNAIHTHDAAHHWMEKYRQNRVGNSNDAIIDPGQFRLRWANDFGRHVFEGRYPATHLEWSKLLKDDTARQQIWDYVAPSPGMNLPAWHGVILDEFAAGNNRVLWTKSFYDEWTETLAKILEDPKYAGRFIMPAYGYNMYDYEKSTAFLRMFIDHGSPLVEEWYLMERDTEEQAWIYFNESAAAVEHRWKQEIPGYTENAIKLLSYLQREIWNPGVNFKVHLEMQFEHFATRPEFFGLGGIGAYSSYNCNSEEYVRWVSKLCRHYGLEGNTERLGTDSYETTQIRNPDFINGTDNWTLRPAAPGSMVVKNHPGYAVMQERYPYRGWTDTLFLWTQRSAEKPNVFSQEIRNLKVGRLYIVRLWIGDYVDLLAGSSKDEPRAVSIRVDGGEVWDDWYRTESYEDKGNVFNYKSYHHPPFGYDNRYNFKIQQLIFRAQAPTAMLSISDWKNNADPGGPIGQELMFNNIDVHPYLEP